MDESFFRGICLKVAFKPEKLRRAQAALIYVALTGETFTADCLPGEITENDNTVSGCAVGALATIGVLQRVCRCKSPSKSRNGAWVNSWKLAEGQGFKARLWLTRNGFPAADAAAANELPPHSQN